MFRRLIVVEIDLVSGIGGGSEPRGGKSNP